MEIKKCPFCGGEVSLVQTKLGKHPAYWIYCNNYNCEIQPQTLPHLVMDEAIEAWNRRVKL